MRAFSSLDEVRGIGSVLLNATFEGGGFGHYLVIPSMRFICSGNITAVKFLAVARNVTTENYIQLGLAKHQGSDSYTLIGHNDTSRATPIEGSRTGFELHFPLGRVQYHAGYTFAMYQRQKLLFHERGEEIDVCSNFMMSYWTTRMICTYTKSRYRPLLTFETGS